MPNSFRVNIAVAADGVPQEEGAQLAGLLGLPVVDLPLPNPFDFDFLLVKTPQHLELRQGGKGAPSPLFVDFLSEALSYRRARSTRQNEAIAKAVGLKHSKTVSVIDATAGLGRDGFILASLGATVTLLERSPIIAALLEDGLARAKVHLPFVPTLIKTDAISFFRTHFIENTASTEAPDVIYLDPMFPPRLKSAAVKKDIRMLQAVLGNDEDEALLLETALQCAKSRVVIKRPHWASLPIPRQPDMKITTPNHYFAVYLKHS